jgi:uncharacterized protein DUF6572
MSIEQLNVVDYAAIDPKTDEVMLVITDHLDWTEQNKMEHMYLLQEKINAYIGSIESGEIFEKYPMARGREIVIKVALMYPLSKAGRRFCEKVTSFLHDNGYKIEFQVSP